MAKIRVGLVGVGNCANALLQGIHFYGSGAAAAQQLQLTRPVIGGYEVSDIEVVAAFDVTTEKVGHDLGEAAEAYPNSTYRSIAPGKLGVRVERGPTLDGIGKYLHDFLHESSLPACNVTAVLREKKVDVLVNYLPVGSEKATHFYATSALNARCAFVNCIPVFIASDAQWNAKFLAAGLPVLGDDIKSQVGATIVHRVLAQLFRDRGIKVLRTLQLNIGGNGDFLNMLEKERLASKKVSKTQAVVSVLGREQLQQKNVHIGPSDYVEWLGDRKWAYMRLEGIGFGGAPLNLELKLEVWDSPNSAGIVIDAVRCAKLALDRGEAGALNAASAYFMKSPLCQRDDDKALSELEAWIGGAPIRSVA